MLYADHFIIMGVGGFFIILGIALNVWGSYEQRAYENSLTTKPDLREFVNHWPEAPQPGALKIGGWIAIGVGLVLLAIGFTLWLRG